MAAWVLEYSINLNDEDAVVSILSNKLSLLKWDQVEKSVLRTPAISDAASRIGTILAVRKIANEFQRECATTTPENWVIVDGRDAGTVVFPNAAVKLFITASPDVRARRRYAQLLERGYISELKEIEEEIIQRDLRDQSREIAPLKPAADAYIIDTSEETVDDSVRRILKYLEKYVAV
jgi:cytidylate kinase